MFGKEIRRPPHECDGSVMGVWLFAAAVLVFQVVVAVEKDSAMAPKKVDYAVLHSTVGWPNSKCGFTKSFTKCMFFLIKWSSLSHLLIHQAFLRGSMLAAPLPFSRGSKKEKMQFENVIC